METHRVHRSEFNAPVAGLSATVNTARKRSVPGSRYVNTLTSPWERVLSSQQMLRVSPEQHLHNARPLEIN